MLANPNRSRRHFLMIFGARMNTIFIVKLKIHVLIKWSHRSPRSRRLLNQERFIVFRARSPISFKHVSSSYMFLEPHLTTYHSNTHVQSILGLNQVRLSYKLTTPIVRESENDDPYMKHEG